MKIKSEIKIRAISIYDCLLRTVIFISKHLFAKEKKIKELFEWSARRKWWWISEISSRWGPCIMKLREEIKVVFYEKDDIL